MHKHFLNATKIPRRFRRVGAQSGIGFAFQGRVKNHCKDQDECKQHQGCHDLTDKQIGQGRYTDRLFFNLFLRCSGNDQAARFAGSPKMKGHQDDQPERNHGRVNGKKYAQGIRTDVAATPYHFLQLGTNTRDVFQHAGGNRYCPVCQLIIRQQVTSKIGHQHQAE